MTITMILFDTCFSSLVSEWRNSGSDQKSARKRWTKFPSLGCAGHITEPAEAPETLGLHEGPVAQWVPADRRAAGGSQPRSPRPCTTVHTPNVSILNAAIFSNKNHAQVCICMYMYVYIYIWYIDVYIYIYIYTYIICVCVYVYV